MAKISLSALYYIEETKARLACISKGFGGKRPIYRDSSL